MVYNTTDFQASTASYMLCFKEKGAFIPREKWGLYDVTVGEENSYNLIAFFTI